MAPNPFRNSLFDATPCGNTQPAGAHSKIKQEQQRASSPVRRHDAAVSLPAHSGPSHDSAAAFVSQKHALSRKEPAAKKLKVFDPSRTAYVSNLAPGASAAELETLFSGYGPVSCIDIPTVAPGVGNAFVEFQDGRSVPRAVSATDGLMWRGSRIRVAQRNQSGSSATIEQVAHGLDGPDTSPFHSRHYGSWTSGDIQPRPESSAVPGGSIPSPHSMPSAVAHYGRLETLAQDQDQENYQSLSLAEIDSLIQEQTSYAKFLATEMRLLLERQQACHAKVTLLNNVFRLKSQSAPSPDPSFSRIPASQDTLAPTLPSALVGAVHADYSIARAAKTQEGARHMAAKHQSPTLLSNNPARRPLHSLHSSGGGDADYSAPSRDMARSHGARNEHASKDDKRDELPFSENVPFRPVMDRRWSLQSSASRQTLTSIRPTKIGKLERKTRSLVLNPYSEKLAQVCITTQVSGGMQFWDLSSKTEIASISQDRLKNGWCEDACWVSNNCLALAAKDIDSTSQVALMRGFDRLRDGNLQYSLARLTQTPHSQGITVIEPCDFSSSHRNDGLCFFTGSRDKSVFLWNCFDAFAKYPEFETIRCHSLHSSAVSALCHVSKRKVLYSGGEDRRFFAYDVESQKVFLGNDKSRLDNAIRELLPIYSYDALVLVGSTSVSDSKKSVLQVFDSRSNSFTITLDRNPTGSSYYRASIHPNGQMVVCPDDTGGIQIWDLRFHASSRPRQTKHAIGAIAYSVACLVMSVLFCMQLAIYLILKLIADSHLFSVNQILFVTQSAVSFVLSLPLAICMLIYISKGEGNAQHQDQQFPMDAIVEPLPSYLPKEQEPPTYATTVNAAEPL
ncbi:hypothetical protein HDV03_002862 [Kappamyces sp. JEL0829]|nr:hypothetical protein HDV03_002862 [Kappamyces sp. JEL0829]